MWVERNATNIFTARTNKNNLTKYIKTIAAKRIH